MPKLSPIITISLILLLLNTSNVYPHQYLPRPIPKFPYTKFSQKPKVVQRIKVQVPKVDDVEVDIPKPSITTIPESQYLKLREFDILPVFNLNFLRVPIVPTCYTIICLGEVTVPPLLLPIISPIADPFNDDLCTFMRFDEFYIWWRIYR